MKLIKFGNIRKRNLLLIMIILSFVIINSNTILTDVSFFASDSSSEIAINGEEFDFIDVPLAFSPIIIQPPQISTLAAAIRTKRVIDEKEVFAKDAVSELKMPTADGKLTCNNDFADIDASNASKGYVMIKVKTTDASTAKYVRVTNSNTSVNYDYLLHILNEYIALPLTEGNGAYTVDIVDTVGTRKVLKNSYTFNVVIEDNITQFLYPNYFVNYNKDSKAVKMANYLCENLTTELSKVQEIYNYVIDNITYDYDLAANNPKGRVPILDNTITTKTGVCFDYASLMTGMLRSVGIPAKLVAGYATNIYHAWISVYIKDIGWINNIIQFDGKTWKLMDPTFAAASSEASDIMKFIGEGKNYNVRFTY